MCLLLLLLIVMAMPGRWQWRSVDDGNAVDGDDVVGDGDVDGVEEARMDHQQGPKNGCPCLKRTEKGMDGIGRSLHFGRKIRKRTERVRRCSGQQPVKVTAQMVAVG